MPESNRSYVDEALELLRQGLSAVVHREYQARYSTRWQDEIRRDLQQAREWRSGEEHPSLDLQAVFDLIQKRWRELFERVLGRDRRWLVSELWTVRRRFSHQEPFSTEETYRALDYAELLLKAISAPETQALERLKRELVPRLAAALKEPDSAPAAPPPDPLHYDELKRVLQQLLVEQETPPDPVPRYWPYKETDPFENRTDELDRLMRLLGTPAIRLISVVGPPGYGTTALVCKLCNQFMGGVLLASGSQAPMRVNGLLYLDCRSSQKPRVELLLKGFGQMLGGAERRRLEATLADPSLTSAERAERLLERLWERHYLLFLDNTDDLLDARQGIADRELRTFIETCLSRSHELTIISTGCREMAVDRRLKHAVDCVKLEKPLERSCSIAMLRGLDPNGEWGLRDEDAEILTRAAEACGDVPAALKQLAEAVSGPGAPTLRGLLADRSLFDEQVVSKLGRQRLSRVPQERLPMIWALAVYHRPVPADAVRDLAADSSSTLEVSACLDRFVQERLITRSDDQSGATYELAPPLQSIAYAQISAQGGDEALKRLHEQAADYHARLLDGYAWELEPRIPYQRWYRYEDAWWQATVEARFYHLYRADRKHEARLAFARLYMDAFWWWGWLIDFPFSERLLHRWAERYTANKDRNWLRWLRQFHTGHGQRDWRKVGEALIQLRDLAGIGGRTPDLSSPDRRQLRTSTDIFLGRAYRQLAHAGVDRDENRMQALERYRDAMELADGTELQAWLLYYLADVHCELQQLEPAAAECQRALSLTREPAFEEQDFELIANVYRVQADIEGKQGQIDSALRDYALASFYAYAFQAFPHAPDLYTRTFYRELIELVQRRVQELCGPGRIEAAKQSLREFWHPYWTSEPALPAIRETDPFPPAPEKQELGQPDSPYATRARQVVGRIRELLPR